MLAAFVVLAVLMTYAGGFLPGARRALSREAMGRLFSLRAGILLGLALTELLPEALALHKAAAAWTAVLAFALFFLVNQFAMSDSCPEYLEDCRVHSLGLAAWLALTGHSFIDGFNLPSAFAAGAPAGVAAGMALGLHKLADGFTLTTLFKQAGLSPKNALLALSAVAAATPLGSALSALGLAAPAPALEAALLGFASGSFLYIAASDIVPRLHRRPEPWGLAAFGAGLAAMAALKAFLR